MNMTADFCGSDKARQEVGDPGHCEVCATVGHVVAHPNLGCGDVGCSRAHSPDPAAKLADTSDPRFTDDQRAAVARFEAAPTTPEIVEARVVEEVARAMQDSCFNHGRCSWEHLAAAAVAAYRAQDGGAEDLPWCNLPICPETREGPHRITAGRCMVVPAPSAQDGGAEEALRRVEALAAEYDAMSVEAAHLAASPTGSAGLAAVARAYHRAANDIRAAISPRNTVGEGM